MRPGAEWCKLKGMTKNEVSAPAPRFRSYKVIHRDGTKGRVMGVDGDYTRISFRENGQDETIEIRTSMVSTWWTRDFS